jgi:hypothetical protein
VSNTEALTAIIALAVFMFGTVLALVWYLGGRIDRLEDHLGGRMDGTDGRLASLEARVQELREDVAVLKATAGQ